MNKLLFCKSCMIAIVIIVTFISYSNSLKNDFTYWDDQKFITENNDIKSFSAENLVKIFSSSYIGMYVPLTVLSFVIEYRFFGLTPFYFHLNNLLLHLLNCLLVFYFIYLLTESMKPESRGRQQEKGRIIRASIVSLYFGIHPMHAESVAWVTERKDLLYSFFFLGGLITYIYYVRRQKLKFLFVTLLLFILSLLSKSAAVTFPLVLILIDYYFKRITFRPQIKIQNLKLAEKLSFFMLAVAFGLINMHTQKEGIIPASAFTITERLLMPFYAASFYIVKFFVPNGLSVHHQHSDYANNALPLVYYLAVAFIVGIFLFATFFKSSINKIPLVFGLLFFLFNIAPVLQIIPVGDTITAERYSYLPYIGLLLPVASFASLSDSNPNKIKSALVAGILLAFAFAFSIITYQRNKVWADTVTLFNDVKDKYPDCFVAYDILGYAYTERNEFDKAYFNLNRANALNPKDALVYLHRSYLNLKLMKYDEVIQDCQKVINIDPGVEKAYNNMGYSYFSLNNYDKALECYNAAIRIKPDFELAYVNRSQTYFILKKYAETIKDCETAIRINPGYAMAYNNLASAYFCINDYGSAVENYSRAAILQPDEKMIYINRGKALLMLQRYAEAIADWETAIKLNPVDEVSLRNLIREAESQIR